jgi:DNA-directed RNA polymerase subunit RPC12/RpoP
VNNSQRFGDSRDSVESQNGVPSSHFVTNIEMASIPTYFCKRCKRKVQKATLNFRHSADTTDVEGDKGLRAFSTSLQRYSKMYFRAQRTIPTQSDAHQKQLRIRLFKQLIRRSRKMTQVCTSCSVKVLSFDSCAHVPQHYWDHLYECAYEATESMSFEDFF